MSGSIKIFTNKIDCFQKLQELYGNIRFATKMKKGNIVTLAVNNAQPGDSLRIQLAVGFHKNF